MCITKTICKKIMAMLIVLATLAGLAFALPSVPADAADDLIIQNNSFWHDTSGNPIYSQGGGVFKFGDTYYWYGVKYNGAVTYYNSPTKKVDDTSFAAVTCYSSKDLVNWKFENNVLTPDSKGFPWCYWFGRLGVAYNKNTKKYVLVSQHNESVLFAECSSPTGDFEVKNIQDYITNVAKQGTGDQTIFIDDDGKAYLICSNKGGRGNQYVAPLRESDYLAAEPATRVANGHGREGNCMFKYKGKYYFCASDLHGWNSSHTYYMVADNIMGPYSEWKVMPDTDKDFSHVTQTGFFVTVHGSEQETVLYCGDRWSDFAGNGIGYNQWVPLSFDGYEPYFNSLSQWAFDAETGNWAVGAGNNYILNPSFDADRVSQTALAGWTNSGTGNGNKNSAKTGRWCMQHWADSAYKATMYQDIELPNGNYTLKAWAKSSGGQNSAKIYIKNYGGDEKNVSIKDVGSSWKEITISDINVTTGKCQVGIYSDAKAGNWVYVDDFSLIGDGSQVSLNTVKDYTNLGSKLVYSPDTANGTEGNMYIGDTELLSGVSYTITNKHSGKNLDIDGGEIAEGTNIQQWKSNGRSNQEWRFVDLGNGYCKLLSMADETMCVSVEEASAEDGKNVCLKKYTGGDNQQWKLVKESGYYGIVSKCSADGAGLDVYDWSTEDGGNVNQWEYWKGDCQLWTINPVYPAVNDGSYTLRNINSGLWIGSDNSGNVIQSDSVKSWSIKANADGTVSLTDENNKALTVEGNKADNGTNISLADFTGGAGQSFKLICCKDGSYALMSAVSESKSCVDVFEVSKENGANIIQWEYHGGEGQRFVIDPVGAPKAPEKIVGDVNADNAFTMLDLTMMQKYLLSVTSLTDSGAGDLNGDGRINVFDFAVMKKLIRQESK